MYAENKLREGGDISLLVDRTTDRHYKREGETQKAD